METKPEDLQSIGFAEKPAEGLLPCPFCGSIAKESMANEEACALLDLPIAAIVGCSGDCHVAFMVENNNIESARQKWNTRPLVELERAVISAAEAWRKPVGDSVDSFSDETKVLIKTIDALLKAREKQPST